MSSRSPAVTDHRDCVAPFLAVVPGKGWACSFVSEGMSSRLRIRIPADQSGDAARV
jgi:hypothetical protein